MGGFLSDEAGKAGVGGRDCPLERACQGVFTTQMLLEACANQMKEERQYAGDRLYSTRRFKQALQLKSPKMASLDTLRSSDADALEEDMKASTAR